MNKDDMRRDAGSIPATMDALNAMRTMAQASGKVLYCHLCTMRLPRVPSSAIIAVPSTMLVLGKSCVEDILAHAPLTRHEARDKQSKAAYQQMGISYQLLNSVHTTWSLYPFAVSACALCTTPGLIDLDRPTLRLDQGGTIFVLDRFVDCHFSCLENACGGPQVPVQPLDPSELLEELAELAKFKF